MKIRYYSQFGDDCILWQLFEFKKDGFFVDVGAFDGIHFSNSYSFEQQGWHGICVEPHPEYYPLCAAARPGSICIEAACVNDEARREVSFQIEEMGLLSGVQIDEADVRGRYQGRGLDFSGLRTVTVPARTLNALLAEHLPAGRSIDFISIDVEGTEADVLRGLDLSRYRPRVLVIETNSAEAAQPVAALLTQAGYQHARRLGVNDFYAFQPADIARLRELQVNCEAEYTLHPRGREYTIAPAVPTRKAPRWRRLAARIVQRLRRIGSAR